MENTNQNETFELLQCNILIFHAESLHTYVWQLALTIKWRFYFQICLLIA